MRNSSNATILLSNWWLPTTKAVFATAEVLHKQQYCKENCVRVVTLSPRQSFNDLSTNLWVFFWVQLYNLSSSQTEAHWTPYPPNWYIIYAPSIVVSHCLQKVTCIQLGQAYIDMKLIWESAYDTLFFTETRNTSFWKINSWNWCQMCPTACTCT